MNFLLYFLNNLLPRGQRLALQVLDLLPPTLTVEDLQADFSKKKREISSVKMTQFFFSAIKVATFKVTDSEEGQ